VLDAARSIDEAVAAAGTDDFGDPRYRDGLDRLLASLRDEAGLTELGEASLAFQVQASLRNRLQVIHWLRDHPEAAASPVERPIVVVGLPRSGTTLLSAVLDCDPAHRSLLRWESRHAVPPPTTATLRTDPRVAKVEAELDALDQLNPGFKAIHHEPAGGPTECVTVLAQDFRSIMWSCMANTPSYSEWLLSDDCDYASAYEYHRRELQVLQSSAPGVWSLKTPQHCLSLGDLFATYPDARLIMTHRDPVAATTSMVSLVRSLTGMLTDADHGAFIARYWTEALAQMMDRVMAWRDEHGDDAFVDLPYGELVADPMAAMARVYRELGDELSPEAESRMRAYVDDNPQHKHGGHRYTSDELGVDSAAAADRFAAYRARFEV
jgi:hypothetical protein